MSKSVINKPVKRVQRNWALRNELIEKRHIIPDYLVPKWLEERGFLEAAKAAAARRLKR